MSQELGSFMPKALLFLWEFYGLGLGFIGLFNVV